MLAFLQGIDKLGSTSSKSTQSESASSQATTPPSTPLRVLRRSGSSHGSGGGSFRHNGSGPRTLMFFKGCPRPLGCTVLLKGADAHQLVLLKKVTKVSSAALQPTDLGCSVCPAGCKAVPQARVPRQKSHCEGCECFSTQHCHALTSCACLHACNAACCATPTLSS